MSTFAEKLHYANTLSKAGNFEEGISILKECLHIPDLRIKDRMMTHYNLGFFYSKGLLKDPNVTKKLTQEEINECATNYSFAKHLYSRFIDDVENKQELKQFRDGAGWALDHCVFKLNASVKYFSGKWGPSGSNCEDFRAFEDYPQDYYVEIKQPTTPSNSKTSKSGCFIATAVYGSYHLHQVLILREFRDSTLSNSSLGCFLIQIYYKVSPAIANYIKNKPNLINLVRTWVLNPIVKSISKEKE